MLVIYADDLFKIVKPIVKKSRIKEMYVHKKYRNFILNFMMISSVFFYS